VRIYYYFYGRGMQLQHGTARWERRSVDISQLDSAACRFRKHIINNIPFFSNSTHASNIFFLLYYSNIIIIIIIQFRLHKSAKEEQASQFFVEWGNYLQHIERTGREKQSMDVGLVDKPTNSNGMMMNGGSGSGSGGGGGTQQQNKSSFGRDVATGIEFNDEQVDQLDKLREEAAKVAGAGGNNDGNDSGGGGGSGNII